MRRCLPSKVHGRAIIGVIALYALFLQAVLGGMTVAEPSSIDSAICAQHATSGLPGDHGPACQHHACCTAVQAAHLLEPGLSTFATVVWAPAPMAAVDWRSASLAQARAPPDQSVSPRGPPAV